MEAQGGPGRPREAQGTPWVAGRVQGGPGGLQRMLWGSLGQRGTEEGPGTSLCYSILSGDFVYKYKLLIQSVQTLDPFRTACVSVSVFVCGHDYEK